MSERAAELANRFTTANDALIGVIQGATDAQLQTICPGEQWSVLLTARHVAISYRVVGSWIRRLARGEAVPTTRQQIDEGNALHAQEFAATVTRDEVLTLLRDNGAKIADTIRNLTDEQLQTGAVMGPAENQELSAEHAIRAVLLHHIRDHLADIRQTIAA